MKIILSIFLISISFKIKATEFRIPWCSMLNAVPIAKELKDIDKIDKFKHCAASCMLTLRCDIAEVYRFGIFKEFTDLLGLGEADLADIEANKIGISFAANNEAYTDRECKNLCDQINWLN